MLLHDAYALHRKWWDWQWKPSFGDDSWTDWDYVLAETLQVIEDYTDNETGQFIPFDQSGEVRWEVESKFSGSAEAIAKKSKERGELKPGESLYAVPIFDDPDNKPTLTSWIEDMSKGSHEIVPKEHEGARPPSAAELEQLMSNTQQMVE